MMEIKKKTISGKDFMILMPADFSSELEKKMIFQAEESYFITPRLGFEDTTPILSYDVSRYRALSEYVKTDCVTLDLIRRIYTSLLEAVSNIQKFMLSENNILIDKDYIFIEEDEGRCRFLLIPETEELCSDIRSLTEFLIRHADTEDYFALRSICVIYRTVASQDFSWEKLKPMLDKRGLYDPESYDYEKERISADEQKELEGRYEAREEGSYIKRGHPEAASHKVADISEDFYGGAEDTKTGDRRQGILSMIRRRRDLEADGSDDEYDIDGYEEEDESGEKDRLKQKFSFFDGKGDSYLTDFEGVDEDHPAVEQPDKGNEAKVKCIMAVFIMLIVAAAVIILRGLAAFLSVLPIFVIICVVMILLLILGSLERRGIRK